MAKYEKAITGQFEKVINHLQNDINNSGITMNLVDESNYTSADTNIAVRVYDKYFMRNGNRASLINCRECRGGQVIRNHAI